MLAVQVWAGLFCVNENKAMKNTEGVPCGRGLAAPESKRCYVACEMSLRSSCCGVLMSRA